MTGDIGIGLATRVGSGIEFQPQMTQVFADQFPDPRGILADASGENQSIHPPSVAAIAPMVCTSRWI